MLIYTAISNSAPSCEAHALHVCTGVLIFGVRIQLIHCVRNMDLCVSMTFVWNACLTCNVWELRAVYNLCIACVGTCGCTSLFLFRAHRQCPRPMLWGFDIAHLGWNWKLHPKKSIGVMIESSSCIGANYLLRTVRQACASPSYTCDMWHCFCKLCLIYTFLLSFYYREKFIL